MSRATKVVLGTIGASALVGAGMVVYLALLA
jgi:hypothetical protein